MQLGNYILSPFHIYVLCKYRETFWLYMFIIMTKQQHHHHNHHYLPKNLENASEFRVFVYHLIESKFFGGAILFVILVNTVVLITQTDEQVAVQAGKSSFTQ